MKEIAKYNYVSATTPKGKPFVANEKGIVVYYLAKRGT